MEISWDDYGSRIFEVGLDRGVFYPKTGPGVPWNGLTSVLEDSEGTGELVVYVDGQRKANQLELGDFSATIEALTYPDEFMPYDGYTTPMFSGQTRQIFNLSYRNLLGDNGYRLHLVYNCLVSPTPRSNADLNSGEATLFSWKLHTSPEAVPFERPTSHIYIDSPSVEPGALLAIENILYGSTGLDPRFPTISEVLAIFEANAIITVTYQGDGVWRVTGPDENVKQMDPTTWKFDWPNVIPLDTHLYRVSSY